jgi:putative PIN family toxin of toxin-antitoxin system
MNQLRVVVDTNIIISALNFGGLPGRIMEEAGLDSFQLYISEPILDEVQRVLTKKFGWSVGAGVRVRSVITAVALVVKPTERRAVIKEDPSDDRILECAATVQAHYIVSGDKHLLKRGQWENLLIVTAAVV